MIFNLTDSFDAKKTAREFVAVIEPLIESLYDDLSITNPELLSVISFGMIPVELVEPFETKLIESIEEHLYKLTGNRGDLDAEGRSRIKGALVDPLGGVIIEIHKRHKPILV